MTNSSALKLAAQGGPWAQLRTGVVVESAGSTVTVLVGATTFEASVVAPVGVVNPAVPPPGTYVVVGRQDSSWIVFGSILGASVNLIENGSFEEDEAGSTPSGWITYQATGTILPTVETVTDAVVGSNILVVTTSTATANGIVYSSPVDVNAGDRIQLSVFASALYDGGIPETADAELLALWFNTDADLYPTTSSPDTVVATAADVLPRPPWASLSGTVTAPVTGVMRLGLRSVLDAGQEMHWDFAVVRRIT
jgi:hypothetical protein